MIKKSVHENELILGMLQELNSKEKNEGMLNLVKAADYVHSALDILENHGMYNISDKLVLFLNKIATDNNVKKKLHDSHTSGLTSDKMVKNLLNHGTVFNMTDDHKTDDLLNLDIDATGADFEISEDSDFEEET